MAILYNKKKKGKGIIKKCGSRMAQSGLKSKPTQVYTENAQEKAPFIYDWLKDPITIDKMRSQFSTKNTDIAGKWSDKISKKGIIDFGALSKLPEDKFKETIKKFSTNPLNNRINSDKYQSSLKAFSKMRQYGKSLRVDENGILRGVRGVRIPGFKYAIGTAFPLDQADDQGTVTHELTHAGYQGLAEKYIQDKWGNKQLVPEMIKDKTGKIIYKIGDRYFNESPQQLDYLRQLGPSTYDEYGNQKEAREGVYPRIMQLRKVLGLKPGQKVTPEMLPAFDEKDIETPLRGLRANWDDATILDILNTVAENKSNYTNTNV